MRSRSYLGTSIVLGSLLASAGASAAPARYTVVELGSFGGRGSYARAIDDQGRIVGWAGDTSDRTRPFRTDGIRPLVARDMLAMPPGDGLPGVPEGAIAMGIANDGTVAGYTRDSRGGEWPWLWLPDGRAVQGARGSGAFTAMSPNGDAAGYVYRWSTVASGMVKAPYVRRADGTTTTFATLDGDSVVSDIASAGLMIGSFRISPSASAHAHIWRGGATSDDLGLFGGPGYKRGTAIASTGRWAGATGDIYAGLAFSAPSPSAAPVELPHAGMVTSEVRGIDAYDRLVGWASTGTRSASVPQAYYWHVGPTDTEVVDLKTRVSGWTGYLMEAAAINAEGVILIDALTGHNNRAVVLVPVKLTVTPPPTMQVGSVAELTVAGCEPGARVQIYKSTSAPIPGRGTGYRAMGIRWDIAGPDIFGPSAVADASGVARIRVNVTGPANQTLYLQAIHRGNKSAVISVTTTPAPMVVPGVTVPAGLVKPQGPPLPVPSGLNLKRP